MPKGDIDDFFSGIKPRRILSPFDRWLAEDPKRAEKLWAVLAEAERRGVPIPSVIERWNETEGQLPVKRAQIHRKWRDQQAGK